MNEVMSAPEGGDAVIDAAPDLLLRSSAKKRSTWLSQDELVGVRCTGQRGLLASHLGSRGREMDVEVARHGCLDLVEELAEIGGTARSTCRRSVRSQCRGQQIVTWYRALCSHGSSGRMAGTHWQHRLICRLAGC